MITREEAKQRASDIENELRRRASVIKWDVTFLWGKDLDATQFCIHAQVTFNGELLRWQHTESEFLFGDNLSFNEWINMTLGMVTYGFAKAILEWKPKEVITVCV